MHFKKSLIALIAFSIIKPNFVLADYHLPDIYSTKQPITYLFKKIITGQKLTGDDKHYMTEDLPFDLMFDGVLVPFCTGCIVIVAAHSAPYLLPIIGVGSFAKNMIKRPTDGRNGTLSGNKNAVGKNFGGLEMSPELQEALQEDLRSLNLA
jgi:hypothetical protein